MEGIQTLLYFRHSRFSGFYKKLCRNWVVFTFLPFRSDACLLSGHIIFCLFSTLVSLAPVSTWGEGCFCQLQMCLIQIRVRHCSGLCCRKLTGSEIKSTIFVGRKVWLSMPFWGTLETKEKQYCGLM